MATRGSGGQPSVLSTLPKDLPLDFLKTITDQFSQERILGTGAFGTVYMGIAPDEQKITMKKLAENSPIARDKLFTNEVQNIMALHHDNVVKLVGYCHEAKRKWCRTMEDILLQTLLKVYSATSTCRRGTFRRIFLKYPV
ncbi:hypothetical protein ACQJBY_013366 [Aegilops geniculata]